MAAIFSRRNVIKHPDEAVVRQASARIFERIVARARSQGHTIDENGFIIGKNLKTGESAPNSQRTERWDTPRVLKSDGSFYISEEPRGLKTKLNNLNVDRIEVEIEEDDEVLPTTQ